MYCIRLINNKISDMKKWEIAKNFRNFLNHEIILFLCRS